MKLKEVTKRITSSYGNLLLFIIFFTGIFSIILYYINPECIKTVNDSQERVINWYQVIGYSMLFSITLTITLVLLFSDCPQSSDNNKPVSKFGFEQHYSKL